MVLKPKSSFLIQLRIASACIVVSLLLVSGCSKGPRQKEEKVSTEKRKLTTPSGAKEVASSERWAMLIRAAKKHQKPAKSSGPNDVETRIYLLKHLKANNKDLLNALEELLSASGKITPTASNALVIRGLPKELDAIQILIDRLDKP